MKLIELITNCINYTTQSDESVTPYTLEQYKNSTNYAAFIKNALPEINRAIQEIVMWKKIPLQCLELTNETSPEYQLGDLVANPFVKDLTVFHDKTLRIELTKEEWDKIYSIFKIEYELSDGRILSPVTYSKIGNKLRLPYFQGTMYIHYYPRVKMFTEADVHSEEFSDDDTDLALNELPDLSEFGINDTMCNLVIPHLVKANIWQEVEPEMAQLERNKGLQNLSMLVNGEEEVYQSSVAVSNTMDWGD